jgi:hypothetical protein
MLIEVTCVGPGSCARAVVGAGRLVHRFKLGLSSCKGLKGVESIGPDLGS